MYCVIQQVMRKKPDRLGEPKEIKVYQNQWRLDENKPHTWAWKYSAERFERPHLEAYKITLHQSYREGGAVRKRQYAVCTMSYYDVCESWWGDFIIGGETALAEKLGMDAAELCGIIEARMEPLRERLETEFHQSAEYIAQQEHRRIREADSKARAAFTGKYGVDADEYDRCYDVFGVLRNREYLKRIQAEHKARKQAERRRYQEQRRSTCSGYSSGSYSVPSVSNYTADETAILKQFYRSLSKLYHPDMNPDKDTTAAMQVLNKLKEQWGV